MKKSIDSIEISGIIALAVWVLNNLIRNQFYTQNPVLLFIMGILPNICAALAALALVKTIVTRVAKKPYSLKIHLFTCLTIIAAALVYETYYHFLPNQYNRPFDILDILGTLAALGASTWLARRGQINTNYANTL